MIYYIYYEDFDMVDGFRVFVFVISLKGDMKLGYGFIVVKCYGV